MPKFRTQRWVLVTDEYQTTISLNLYNNLWSHYLTCMKSALSRWVKKQYCKNAKKTSVVYIIELKNHANKQTCPGPAHHP